MSDDDSSHEGTGRAPGTGPDSGRASVGSSGAPTGGTANGSSAAVGTSSRGSSWLLPLVALLLGLALGAGIMGLLAQPGGGQTESATPPLATTAPTPTATGQSTAPEPGREGVMVPASCLQIAEEAQSLNTVLVDGVQAARDLDASTLSGIVREFGRVQVEMAQLSEDCRAGAGTPVTTTPTAPAGETPAATPTDEVTTPAG